MSSINDTFILDPKASINNIKSSHNQFMNEIKSTSLYNLLKNSKLKYVYNYSTAPTGWTIDAKLGQINVDRSEKYSVLEFSNPSANSGQNIKQNISDVLEPNCKYTLYYNFECSQATGVSITCDTGVLTLSPSNPVNFVPTVQNDNFDNYITFLTADEYTNVQVSIINNSLLSNDVTVKKFALVKGGVEFLEAIDPSFFVECLIFTHDDEQDAPGEWSWKITEDGLTYKRLFNISKVDDDYFFDSSYTVDADGGYITLKDTSLTVLRDIETYQLYKLSVKDSMLIIENVPNNIIPRNPNGISLRNFENNKCQTIRINNGAVELHEIPYDANMAQSMEILDYITGIVFTVTIESGGIKLVKTRFETSNNVIRDSNGNKYYLSIQSNAIHLNSCDISAVQGSGIYIKDSITTSCYQFVINNGVFSLSPVAFNNDYKYCLTFKNYSTNTKYNVVCKSGVLDINAIAGGTINADTLNGYPSSSFVLTSNYTANDVLTKIKTVDGTGSGLDADLLDGHDSSYFTGLVSALNFDSSLVSAGYQKLPSGLILQWKSGTVDPADSTEPTQTITFPITFPTSCLMCFASTRISSASNLVDHWYQTVGTPSTSSVIVQRQHATTGQYAITTTPVILAIGY